MRTAFKWLAIGALFLIAIAWYGLGKPWAVFQQYPQITVAKETTFLTAPLTADGMVDYEAVVNERWQVGVTPENNAVVQLIQALGPTPERIELSDEYFRRLGVPRPNADGRYFVELDQFFKDLEKQRREIAADADPSGTSAPNIDEVVDDNDPNKEPDTPDELLSKAQRKLWSPDDFPTLASWLETNEASIAIAAEASQRARFYEPVVVDRPRQIMLMTAMMPVLGETQKLAEALAIRATLRAQLGQTDAAFEDLFACHRLARLVSQGPCWMHSLVSVSIENAACVAERTITIQGVLSEEQIRKLGQELDQLQTLPPIAEKIKFGERLFGLDLVVNMAREGVDELSGSAQRPAPSLGKTLNHRLMNAVIDWDQTLRTINAWYDRVEIAAANHPGPERQLAMAAFDNDAASFCEEESVLPLSGLFSDRTARGNRMAAILVNLLPRGIGMMLDIEDRCLVQQRLTRLTIALTAYRAAHGKYPDSLAELVPVPLAELPKDIFSGADFVYQPQDNGGYLLYSVGRNGADDRGRNQESDPNAQPVADDIVVRAPENPK